MGRSDRRDGRVVIAGRAGDASQPVDVTIDVTPAGTRLVLQRVAYADGELGDAFAVWLPHADPYELARAMGLLHRG